MKCFFKMMLVISILLLVSFNLLASGTGEDAAKNTTVGVIYVGTSDDFGYNQAQAEGAAALKNIEGVVVLEEEKVPESISVQQTMKSMIELDGASIIFPTSFGYYNPHVLEVAPLYPDVQFVHCGGLYEDGHPENVYSFFGYIDEGQYLNGIAAGYSTKTDKLGFIAAKPIPQVLRNINAFTLGAQSVNPDITVTVIFTGDWMLPVEEANATNTLADNGIDVVTMHVDSPKIIIQTAQKREIFVCGYHVNQSSLAPDNYLIGAEWNWPAVYTYFVKTFMDGSKGDHFYRGGLKDGFIKISSPGPSLSAEAVSQIEKVKALMMEDGYSIFKGPLYDNTGQKVIAEGVSLIQTDPVLEQMGYLVAGVSGSTGF